MQKQWSLPWVLKIYAASPSNWPTTRTKSSKAKSDLTEQRDQIQNNFKWRRAAQKTAQNQRHRSSTSGLFLENGFPATVRDYLRYWHFHWNARSGPNAFDVSSRLGRCFRTVTILCILINRKCISAKFLINVSCFLTHRYNCGDVHCYADLARLRGLKYVTWEDESKVIREDDPNFREGKGPHLKHSNYKFDSSEFVRLVKKCVLHVKKSGSYHDEL